MNKPVGGFEEKIAVITGGSSGIGLATARLLHRDAAPASLFPDAIRLAAAGAGARTLIADMAQPEDVQRALDRISGGYGKLDILIANATAGRRASPNEIGMRRTYYSAVERGEKNLQLDTLERVCTGL